MLWTVNLPYDGEWTEIQCGGPSRPLKVSLVKPDAGFGSYPGFGRDKSKPGWPGPDGLLLQIVSARTVVVRQPA